MHHPEHRKQHYNHDSATPSPVLPLDNHPVQTLSPSECPQPHTAPHEGAQVHSLRSAARPSSLLGTGKFIPNLQWRQLHQFQLFFLIFSSSSPFSSTSFFVLHFFSLFFLLVLALFLPLSLRLLFSNFLRFFFQRLLLLLRLFRDFQQRVTGLGQAQHANAICKQNVQETQCICAYM